MSQGSQWENRIVVILFVVTFVSFAIAGISGFAWEILNPEDFSFWIIIATYLLAISAVTVLTYSFVSFTQKREVRHLMLLLMSANIILWGILYLLSHPSSAIWSEFADRDRNRTLAMALVLIVIPTILLGTFTGEMKPSRPSVLLLILWGTVVLPVTSLVLFFSPEPLFQMVIDTGGGILGLTTIGAIISMGYLFSQIIAVPRLAQIWWRSRNSIDLSLFLAMLLWLFGTIFIIVLWDPNQVAEILWIVSIITGFLLIAVVEFVTSIIYPHRHLEELINLRTKELNVSKQESDFYLKMFAHKMGNYLQGMITYLEILEMADQSSEEDKKTRAAASDLSRQAAMINQQVVQLSRVKESMDQVLWPVNLSQIVDNAIKGATELLGEDAFTVKFSGQDSIVAKGDNLLPLAFQSAISFHLKYRLAKMPEIEFNISERDTTPCVTVTSRGRPIPEELKSFIESDGMTDMIALDIDLFTLKLLMSRYRAQVRCSRDESNEKNSCTYIFPSI